MMDQIRVIYGSAKGTYISKMALRGVSVLLCIIMIGLAGHLATRSVDYYYSEYYLPIAILGAQTCIAVIWDVAEALCIIFRRGHRGAHPGACVGMDLILWLSFIVGAVCINLVCWGDTCGYYDNYYETEAPPMAFRTAFIALNSLLVIVHFALFVIACWETSIRNRAVRIVIDKNNPQMDTNAQQLFSAYWAQLEARGLAPPVHAMKGYTPYAQPVGQYMPPPAQVYQPQGQVYGVPQGQPLGQGYVQQGQPGQAYRQSQVSAPGTVVSEPSEVAGHSAQPSGPSPITTPSQA